jgi:hypothetical protein
MKKLYTSKDRQTTMFLNRHGVMICQTVNGNGYEYHLTYTVDADLQLTASLTDWSLMKLDKIDMTKMFELGA